MLTPIRRDDVAEGLVFSLGSTVQPGTGVVFIRSSQARTMGDHVGTFHEQSLNSLEYVKRAARAVSVDAKIAKVRRYMTSGRGHRDPETRTLWVEQLGTPLPASTSVEVPGTPLVGSVIDLEAWAAVPSNSLADDLVRAWIGEDLFPAAVAVRGDQDLCTAAVRPEPSPRVEGEVRSCLIKLTELFESAGARETDVVKLTAYFRDPRSWPAIQAMVFGRYGEYSPILTGVVVSNLFTRGGHVEMTGWARCGSPAATLSANGMVRSVSLRDELLFTTGTGAVPIFTGGRADEMYRKGPPATIEDQTRLSMESQIKILQAAGASLNNVFRSNWYVTDIRDWESIEPILHDYFGGTLPVPVVVEVSRLTAKQGVRFEPDLWATIPLSSADATRQRKV